MIRDADSAEAVMWSEVASSYTKPLAGVDTMITVDLDSYYVTDFEKRREIMQKSAEVSRRPIENLGEKIWILNEANRG